MAGQQANAPDNSGYTHLGLEFFIKVAKKSLVSECWVDFDDIAETTFFKVMLLIGSQNILSLKK